MSETKEEGPSTTTKIIVLAAFFIGATLLGLFLSGTI